MDFFVNIIEPVTVLFLYHISTRAHTHTKESFKNKSITNGNDSSGRDFFIQQLIQMFNFKIVDNIFCCCCCCRRYCLKDFLQNQFDWTDSISISILIREKKLYECMNVGGGFVVVIFIEMKNTRNINWTLVESRRMIKNCDTNTIRRRKREKTWTHRQYFVRQVNGVIDFLTIKKSKRKERKEKERKGKRRGTKQKSK